MAKIAEQQDNLAQVIADSLNKMKKNETIAFFLGEDDSPTDVKEWVSTGCVTLDLAISNRPEGGIPTGRITELTGLEGSGKSLVAAHALADTQKRGGVAVLIDTEVAVNEDFFRAVGIDMTKLVYVHVDTVEDAFQAAENIIEKVRSSNKDRLVTIVIDSIAGASTEAEREADYGKDGYATGKAIILGKAMRKITTLIGKHRIAMILTNQLRQKMNAQPFADPWTTSGGKAVAFHSSVRVRLSQTGKLDKADGDGKVTVGVKTKAKILKNRMGPPLREAEFEIYFDRGIDDNKAWYDTLKEIGIVKQGGAYFTCVDHNGEEHKLATKEWGNFLAENEERRAWLYEQICNHLIMKYKSDEGDIIESEVSEDTGE